MNAACSPWRTSCCGRHKLDQPRQSLLQPYVNPDGDVPDEEAALQGACDIVAEHWSEDIDARSWLLQQALDHGHIVSQVKRGKQQDADKFEMYFDHREPVKRIPSHRLLAMKRGEAESLLRIGVGAGRASLCCESSKPNGYTIHSSSFTANSALPVDDCYSRLLLPATESSVLQQLKEQADEEAIGVFAKNLRELLLAPPAGAHVTIGIDPGFRTGCKVAVVDGTGKLLTHTTIYPTPPRSDTTGAAKTLDGLIAKYGVKLIAIGNGTASRETDAFVTQVLRAGHPDVTKVTVSESGASIYSASELAAHEYPDLDVTVRGAISIAHRLQDPLGRTGQNRSPSPSASGSISTT